MGKTERRCKELQFQIDEDKKNQDRMAELASKLQQKIRPTRSRLRRPRRLLPSTWPSSARLSRSSRKLRTEQRWLRQDLLLDLSKLNGLQQSRMTTLETLWT